jgi:hypothetical protein
MKEIWKDVPGYEGLYMASNLGRIKSLDMILKYKDGRKESHKGRILKLQCNRNGYYKAVLYKKVNRKEFFVHRLILLSFYKHKNLDCNHKDGNKKNNYLNNLEYCTRSENVQHAYNMGLKKGYPGENNPKSKLTNKRVIRIRWIHNNVKIPKYFWKNLSKFYGVHVNKIYAVIRNETWSHI